MIPPFGWLDALATWAVLVLMALVLWHARCSQVQLRKTRHFLDAYRYAYFVHVRNEGLSVEQAYECQAEFEQELAKTWEVAGGA